MTPVIDTARITSPQGQRSAPVAGATTTHNGQDWVTSSAAKNFRHTLSGTIVLVKDGYNYGRGTQVILKHVSSKGSVIFERHQHAKSVSSKQGDIVRAGTIGGVYGSTGNVSGPHDHVEYILGGTLAADGEIRGGTVLQASLFTAVTNAVGTYPLNNKVYDYDTKTYSDPTGGDVNKGDEDVKLGVYSPIPEETFRTSLLIQQPGQWEARMENGKMVFYKRRIARDVDETSISAAMDSLLYATDTNGNPAPDILEGDIVRLSNN